MTKQKSRTPTADEENSTHALDKLRRLIDSSRASASFFVDPSGSLIVMYNTVGDRVKEDKSATESSSMGEERDPNRPPEAKKRRRHESDEIAEKLREVPSHVIPESLQPGMRYTTIPEVIKSGVTRYSELYFRRLVRDGIISSVRLGHQDLLPLPQALIELLEYEQGNPERVAKVGGRAPGPVTDQPQNTQHTRNRPA